MISCQQPVAAGKEGAPKLEYVVLVELGKKEVVMQPNTNIRMFNTNELHGGESITYDEATGTLTLLPGTYRVDAYSISTFGYMLTKDQAKNVRSLPGYAFLWNVDEKKMAVLGSMQDPMYAMASHVNDVLEVPKKSQFYLGHQNGAEVDGLYVETYDPNVKSTNHVFARMIVQKLQ